MTTAAWWIAILAFVISGLFASLHKSLRTASRTRVRRAAVATKRENAADDLIEHKDEYALAASVVCIAAEIVGVAAVLLIALGAEGVLAERWPVVAGAAAALAAAVYITGAAIPMSVAEHAGEGLVVRMLPALRLLRAAMTPLLAVARFTDEVVRRLSGAPELSEEEELEEEILSVVSDRRDDGSLDESGKDMIEAVVDFRTSTVEEIMTPRTEIEGIEVTASLSDVRDYIATAGHSRIPVYEENLDNIVGILYAKDLLTYLGGDESAFDLRGSVRESRFIPETKRVDELLSEFKHEKVHMAIVLDEYGGTAGLVTIEDVIEEIVGEIHDEYEPETDAPPEIAILDGERAAEIDGRAYIDDINDKLEDLGAALPEHEDYDTLGGYVTTSLGHIPVAGESFRHNGFLVTVLEAEPTRVSRVRVDLLDDESEHDRPVPVDPDPSAEDA